MVTYPDDSSVWIDCEVDNLYPEQRSVSGQATIRNEYDGSGIRSKKEGAIDTEVQITVSQNGTQVASKIADVGPVLTDTDTSNGMVVISYNVGGLDLTPGEEVTVCVKHYTSVWSVVTGAE